MVILKSLEELQSWDSYRNYTKERLKLMPPEGGPIFLSREKVDFQINGKPWPGAAILVDEKGAVFARKLKAKGVKMVEGRYKLEGKTIMVEGFPGALVKRARLTLKKLVLGYELHSSDDPEGNEEGEGLVAAPPSAAELEARFKALLPAVKETATKKPEKKSMLTTLVTAVQKLLGDVNLEGAAKGLARLQEALQDAAEAVAAFQKMGYDEEQAQRMAKVALSLQARGYDEAKTIQMAKRAADLEAKGYDAKRAVTCAIVHQDLVDEGIPEKKVEHLSTMTNPKGTAGVEDAKAAAIQMAKFPADMLAAMSKGGAAVVSCRGSVTDALPELKGVKPRGWPDGMTWDNVPGLYDPSNKEVLLATKGDDHHVAKNGEDHGAFDLAGHEGGHCYDDITGTKKSSETAFKSARQKDIDRLAKDKKDLGAYFMQAGNAGREETFAESCARYFGKDATMSGDWTDLHKFFAGNPYGS